MKLHFLIFFITINLASPAFCQKVFTTLDKEYEADIKSVMLHPASGAKSAILEAPVIPLNQQNQLLLSFDDLTGNPQSFYVKIIHCNADWTVSTLSSIQYLYEYNEFFITERVMSSGTKTPYVHYTFLIPKVKISGNYLVKVYRDYDEEDLILTRRFMVYEEKVIITPNIQMPVQVSHRDFGQQVDFQVMYGNYPMINPQENLYVTIRQNHRWDNAISGLKPLYLDEFSRRLDFNFYDSRNVFPGYNEFRAFDTRSIITPMLNIGKIIKEPDYTQVILLSDDSRAGKAFTTLPDANGKFFPEHYETGDGEINPDYAYITFSLDILPQKENIYIIGGFNNWLPQEAYRMQYDENLKKYICTALLKQGYYNYSYAVLSGNVANQTVLEGSHSATENIYEIITYFRPPGERADYIVGYKEVRFAP